MAGADDTERKDVAAIATPLVADKAVQIDNDSDIMDVFAVFDKTGVTAKRSSWNII